VFIKKRNFKDHALTDRLGKLRTRVIYALAGDDRGHELNYGFSPCRLGQKAWRGVIKSEYNPNKVRHCGDAEYSYVPHLKNL
jgi:hypothetical protein